MAQAVRKFILTNFQDYEALAFKCVYKALIVECIRRSIHGKILDNDRASKYFFGDQFWMQDSLAAWKERFPYLSLPTIKRYLKGLCDTGYVIRSLSNTSAGRGATFYRINPELDLFLKVQKAKAAILGCGDNSEAQSSEAQSSNFTEPKAQIEPAQSSERAMASLITNISLLNQTKISAKNRPSPSWPIDHHFSAIFGALTKVPACAKQFDLEKYNRELLALKEELAVTDDELLRCANAWQRWHNEPGGKKPQKAWANFEGWVKRNVEWNERKREEQKTKGAKPTLAETYSSGVAVLKQYKLQNEAKKNG